MILKPLEDITQADIEALVADKVSEGQKLEYKQEIHGGKDADVKEFLADVSSFANAVGGDIVYGVEEERDASGKPTGIPTAARGLKEVNADATILRMQSSALSG